MTIPWPAYPGWNLAQLPTFESQVYPNGGQNLGVNTLRILEKQKKGIANGATPGTDVVGCNGAG